VLRGAVSCHWHIYTHLYHSIATPRSRTDAHNQYHVDPCRPQRPGQRDLCSERHRADTTCNSTTEVDDDCESVKLAFATSLPSNVSLGSTDETTASITDDTVAVPAHPMSLVIQERDNEMFTAGNWDHVQTVPATAVEEFDPADD
jgi:hypothetical protein